MRSVADKKPKKTDFDGYIINKPWGSEFLIYQDKHIGIWFLHIKKNQSTSFHAHPLKKSALVVLSGEVVFSTLNEWYDLGPLDAINIDSGVFHTTRATSLYGSYVLEVETPPIKHDLIRLKDEYGRAGTMYEDTSFFVKPGRKDVYFSLDNRNNSIILNKLQCAIFLLLNNKNTRQGAYDYKDNQSVCCHIGASVAVSEMIVQESDQFPQLKINRL